MGLPSSLGSGFVSHGVSQDLGVGERVEIAVYDLSGPQEPLVGVTVVLLDTETDEEVTYRIVGEDESDVANGRISFTSPIARGLLGKRVDDPVTVRVPKGTREFEVREIRLG